MGYSIGFEKRKKLINSFIYANFNYCPLVWHFISKISLNKIENIHKRALRFILNDYSSDYETLLKKNNKCTMAAKRLRLLALEIFNAFNENCSSFIKDFLEKKENYFSKKYNLKIPIRNSLTFGDSKLRFLAPRVWNSLPKKSKTETSYVKFKEEIENAVYALI